MNLTRDITYANNWMNENRAARVADGIEWLNENGPADWWTRVDLSILDVSDGYTCVLGQVFADKAAETGLTTGYYWATWSWPYEEPLLDAKYVLALGFCTTLEESGTSQLEDEWRTQIEDLVALVNA
jgi:hypothetical protein